MKLPRIQIQFSISPKPSPSLIIGGILVIGMASFFVISTTPVFGQVASAWNIQKDSSNNLNFYYSTAGNDVLKLNSGQLVNIPGSLGIGTGNINPNSDIEIRRDDADSSITFHDPGQTWWTLGDQRVSGGYFMINGGGDLVGGTNAATIPAISFNPSSYKTGLRALNSTAYTLYVPGLSGDTGGAGYFGSSASTYTQWALTGESYSGPGVFGKSEAHVGVYGLSTGNAGVWGNSINNYGVSGTSTNSYGVGGTSTNSYGVYGQSNNNVGVAGYSTASHGVYGQSSSATGTYGASTSGNGAIGTSGTGNGVYGTSTSASGVLATSTNGTGLYAASTNAIGLQATSNSTNNWAGWFYSSGSPYGLYARADSGTPGWTMMVDRVTDNAFGGGGELLLQNYGPENDNGGFFILAQSDVNNNQGPAGYDLEFYVRGDGYVASDNGMQGGGADVAEWTPSKFAQTLEPGDVVMTDGTAADALTKKSDGTPYSSKLMGIISTNPGLISGGGETEVKHGQNDVLVALTGRVPTKVSTENGTINPGDFLTSSSTPGVAMKATKSGMVVGKALEAFGSSGVGKITVWVQPLWYGGETTPQAEIDQLKKDLEDLKKKLK